MLVDLLDVQEGERVFDIGTGGGSVLYPLARKVGASGRVIGSELCDHFAKATATEIKRCKIKNAEVHFMDARITEFDDDSFDCITAGFIGWDDYFDFEKLEYKKPDNLMSAVRRLVKPGGKFGVSTWLLQEDLDWMYEFLKSHSIDSRRNYSIENQEGWKVILLRSGFHNIRFFNRPVTYSYHSIDHWWDEMMDYNWLRSGDDSEIISDSIKKEAFSSVEDRLTNDGKVPFRRDALLVTAVLEA